MKNVVRASIFVCGVISLFIINPTPAKADLFCWPWESNCTVDGIPGSSRNTGSESGMGIVKRISYCKQVGASDSMTYIIFNDTNYRITFSANNSSWTVEPDSGILLYCYDSPSKSSRIIEFDSSIQNGYQKQQRYLPTTGTNSYDFESLNGTIYLVAQD